MNNNTSAESPASAPTSPSPSAPASADWRTRLGGLASPLGLLVLAALLFFGWQWFDARHQIDNLEQELARRLRDSDRGSQESLLVAKQTQDALREAEAKLTLLEAKLQESQNQQVALEALYQELSRGRDEWVLAEVEQILSIAAQQLQLAGNVPAAMVALQTADARLARSGPQFVGLRKALARDIERLRDAPNLDLTGLSLKIEQVINAVDGLPLVFEARPGERAAKTVANAEPGYWGKLGLQAWEELRQLIRVENMERQDPILLAPNQTFFLRENIKLRLVNARLALLQRDQGGYGGDIRAVTEWVNRYFDTRAKSAAAVLANLRQLGAASVNIEAPGIGESLAALRGYKAAHEKAPR